MIGYVLYVEGCSPKLRRFKDPKKLDKFVENFRSKKEDLEDNWIDMIFLGMVTYVDPSFKLEKDDANSKPVKRKANKSSKRRKR